MGFEALVPLLIQYGLPFVEHLITQIENKTPVTVATFADLKAEGQLTAADQVKALLVSKGIPLDSDKAKQFLALASA